MNKSIRSFKLLFLLIGFLLQFKLLAQFTDTTTNVYQDKDLVTWTESYIVKAGFVLKTIKEYQVPLFSSYYKDLSGLYSISIIERQEYDSLSVTLYWLHAGTDNDRPVIIKRITSKNEKSTFQAIGRKRDLLSLHKIHLLFEKYKNFSKGTQLFCFNMLLENYEWAIQGYEE